MSLGIFENTDIGLGHFQSKYEVVKKKQETFKKSIEEKESENWIRLYKRFLPEANLGIINTSKMSQVELDALHRKFLANEKKALNLIEVIDHEELHPYAIRIRTRPGFRHKARDLRRLSA